MELIRSKFEEWTKGLDPKKARIAVFDHIRDIPYAIIPELRDPDRGPCGILELNKGSCQPKHYLLGQLFGILNIPIKYATYPFRWASLPVRYPPDLKKIIKNMPIAYHLACKAYIGNRWVLIDATVDPPLKKAGFTVNEKWNGSSDTLNTVVPLEEIIHESVEDRVRYEAERKGLYTEEEKAASTEFVERFNKWAKNLRGAR